MSKRTTPTAALLALALLALLPTAALGADGPAWKLSATSQPTNLVPGSSGEGIYLLLATNVGSQPTSGEITVTDTLPPGLAANGPFVNSGDPATAPFTCTAPAQVVTCKSAGPLHAGRSISVKIPLDVSAPAGSVLDNEAEVSGGGATEGAKAQTHTTIALAPPPFDFLPSEEGFRAPLIEADGKASEEAGSHPHEGIVDLGFPTTKPGGQLTGAGHVRDVSVNFPPGMVANPAATPSRCTEAQLTTDTCPDGSQVGTVTITTFTLAIETIAAPLYNMVPPPGAPASFGFNALGVGIYPHVLGRIRSESDYGASGVSHDILARGLNPVLDVSAELWGDPAGKAHDFARGGCLASDPPPCKVDLQPDAFLTMPGDCPGQPLHYSARAASWEKPFPHFQEREAQYESADLHGNPVVVKGCGGLLFEPSLTLRPTTNAIDSPSGLDVVLHQPQETRLSGRARAALRNARVTLPEGLSVNASQADGLAACSSTQIGMLSAVGERPAHFAAAPSACPDAAKIGTVEVTSPLLAQYDEKNQVQRDVEGNAIPEPLHGSVYVAKPFDNPFGSLLAVYLTVEDPKTGIFAKLAGKVEPDPVTGQLTTSFAENPQLPLQEARIHLFTGARAPLQTPPSCGPHTTKAELTPWSKPEAVALSDSFTTTATPAGGPCPPSGAGAPNSPSFTAGTLEPLAGRFSTLVTKLSRQDGTQRLARFEATLAPGISGKLAGIATCSEAQIAAALARSNPSEGALEQASPSCPAASVVGSVDVGAGAGPTPFHIAGRLYLAGPYKGAPLSFVTITPALAGPFDLGTVVVRAPLYLDPSTAQVRAVSDPFPQILHGIPVDVRSVAVTADRPNFTLNPTNCNPLTSTAAATSIFGSVAPLSDRFGVTGCASLPYKPKLHTRLFGPTNRGAHPRFRTVFEAKPGEANTARIVFALPSSEFIDQAHFRTICTRVQFAADQCPAGSIYGHIRAISPLVDYPLQGPVYLRSSTHKLPDVVAALRGPAYQPIEVDLAGRVDSVNGGLRTTFELVPDAPVTKAVVTLQGAKKGLFQNSTNICKGVFRANVKLSAQNGRIANLHPQMKADCRKAGKPKGGKRHGR